MKLSDWAKEQGIAYITAWRWFKKGKLPVAAYKTPTGTILVEPKRKKSETGNKSTWVYCRVSSYDKKADLGRQVERCIAFCAANGWSVEKVVKEVASGMNDHRPKLTKLLNAQGKRVQKSDRCV